MLCGREGRSHRIPLRIAHPKGNVRIFASPAIRLFSTLATSTTRSPALAARMLLTISCAYPSISNARKCAWLRQKALYP